MLKVCTALVRWPWWTKWKIQRYWDIIRGFKYKLKYSYFKTLSVFTLYASKQITSSHHKRFHGCLSQCTWWLAHSETTKKCQCKCKKRGTTPWRRIAEMEVQLHSFLTSALDGGEWSASRTSRFISGVRVAGSNCTEGWVGPRAGMDDMVKGKNPIILPAGNLAPPPRLPVVQPVIQKHLADAFERLTYNTSHTQVHTDA
jgi:hypothetical protein